MRKGIERLTIYVGVNEGWRGDVGDFFEVSSDCLEEGQEMYFTTQEAALEVTRAINRAYYMGKSSAKKELIDWFKGAV